MTKDQNPKYDLEERTAKFGENIIKFCNKLPKNIITNPLINQLIKAGTSVGANYCEADDAESRDDFRHKIGIVKKECRESKQEAIPLWQEAKELNLIFNKIYQKVR